MNKKLSAVAAVLLIAVSLLYTPEGLETNLFRSIVLICSFMLLLVTNALPMMLLSLLCIGLMPILGVTESFASSFSGFSNQAVYFVMMSFGFAAVLMETPICKRILKWMFQRVGKDIEGLILALMICTALTSAFISDVPTCVLYMTFGELILNIYQNEEEKRKSGKSMMIAISIASMIGGISTPVGSTVNILALSILEDTTGLTINFVQWVSICLPIVVILIPISWKIITKIYKPCAVREKDRIQFINSFAEKEKLSGKEIKTIMLFALMIVLWFASSWIKSISTMHVMFLGVCIFALPGIGVTTIDSIIKNVKFDILLLVATILTLCNALMENGFGDFVAAIIPAINVPNMVLILAITVVIYLLIIVVPIAPSLTTIVVPTLIVLAEQMGVNPCLLIPICSISIGCGYFLPMDSVFLMTYSKGYYSIKEFCRVSVFILCITSVLAATIAYGIMGLWGFV